VRWVCHITVRPRLGLYLRAPPIPTLSEATSARETETVRETQPALAALAKGRIPPVIAHRLATIRGADRIVVMSDSGVVEQGSHGELIRTDGICRRLHDAQHLAPSH